MMIVDIPFYIQKNNKILINKLIFFTINGRFCPLIIVFVVVVLSNDE
jgi:hypothetical protein